MTPPLAAEVPRPEGPTVLERFRRVAVEGLERVAVRHRGGATTYGALLETADRIAAELRAGGHAPGVPIAVEGPPGPELVARVLGILEAGGAVALVDPDRSRAGDVAPALAVAPGAGGTGERPGDAAVRPDPAAAGAPEPPQTAAVIWTSGAGGEPRPVHLDLRALALRVRALEVALEVTAGDRVAAALPRAAPSALEDLLLPLAAGATLCLPAPEDLADDARLAGFLAGEAVTVVRLLPSVAGAVLACAGPAGLPGIRRLVLSGEPVPEGLPDRLAAALTDPAAIVSLYALAEAGPVCLAATSRSSGRVALGSMLPGAELAVLSPRGIPCGRGEPGELWVRTPYAGWSPGPEAEAVRRKWLRTGDRGRRRGDGAVELLGLMSGALRIKGARVEPAEVEAVLLSLPGIREAAVAAHPDATGALRLVGYLVAAAGLPPSDETNRVLFERLPEEAVPAELVALPRLPRLASGKIDRRALPAPSAPVFTRPWTHSEVRVAAIVGELLGQAYLELHDDFFARGGHSLLLAVLCSRLNAEFGIELKVRDAFEDPTVRGIAALVDQGLAARATRGGEPVSLVPARPAPSTPRAAEEQAASYPTAGEAASGVRLPATATPAGGGPARETPQPCLEPEARSPEPASPAATATATATGALAGRLLALAWCTPLALLLGALLLLERSRVRFSLLGFLGQERLLACFGLLLAGAVASALAAPRLRRALHAAVSVAAFPVALGWMSAPVLAFAGLACAVARLRAPQAVRLALVACAWLALPVLRLSGELPVLSKAPLLIVVVWAQLAYATLLLLVERARVERKPGLDEDLFYLLALPRLLEPFFQPVTPSALHNSATSRVGLRTAARGLGLAALGIALAYFVSWTVRHPGFPRNTRMLLDFGCTYAQLAAQIFVSVSIFRLMGYDLPSGFRRPFLAWSFAEFFRRYNHFVRDAVVSAFLYPLVGWFRRRIPPLPAALLGSLGSIFLGSFALNHFLVPVVTSPNPLVAARHELAPVQMAVHLAFWSAIVLPGLGLLPWARSAAPPPGWRRVLAIVRFNVLYFGGWLLLWRLGFHHTAR